MFTDLHRGTLYTLTATGTTDASVEAVSKSGRILHVYLEGESTADDVHWVLLHRMYTVEPENTAMWTDTADDSFNTSGAWDIRPAPGTYIHTTGFVNAANNGVFKVVSASSTKIIVDANLTTEGGSPTVTVLGGIGIGDFKTGSGGVSFPWPIHFENELFVGQSGNHVGTISIEYE